jgi:hypothetical protein
MDCVGNGVSKALNPALCKITHSTGSPLAAAGGRADQHAASARQCPSDP